MSEERVKDFLHQVGFTEVDIDEFFDTDWDIESADGTRWLGPDCLYVEVLEEEEYIEPREEGREIDFYWERGWISGYCRFRRCNFDSYKGRYHKAFPTRYDLREFKFTKSLRRVLNKNSDLRTVIRPLRITPAKCRLHDLHHFARYGEEPRETLLKSYEYIKFYPADLTELCIFNGKKLIACSIFEVGTESVYSNTGFWDVTETRRSLGILTILLEIQHAIKKGLRYYYLGNFNPHNPNYLYKTRFGGLTLFDWNYQHWYDFKSKHVREMLKQKLPRHKE